MTKTEPATIPQPKIASLYYAKVAVMAAVAYVQKTRNNNLKYSFASEADLIRALRPAMIDQGLSICPIAAEIISEQGYNTNSGAYMRLARTRHRFRLCHAESGEYEDIEVFGEASDSGDKTLAKCQTIAYKYAIRQAFMIETGDDPDLHQDTDGGAPTKRRELTPVEAWQHKLQGVEGKSLAVAGKAIWELKNETICQLLGPKGDGKISEEDRVALTACTMFEEARLDAKKLSIGAA